MLRTLLNRLIQFVSIVLVAILLLVVLNWIFLTKLKVGIDLRSFARAVRKSRLSLDDKERLLDTVERLEDRVDSGEAIDLFRWWQHSEAIEDMLDAGIEGDEVRLIEREIDRSEKDLEKS